MGTSKSQGTAEALGERRWARRKEARPAEIVTAALACFAERGFAATRLDDVAAKAGVTKGTVYLYFASKEELFKAVVRESLVPMFERMVGDLKAEAGNPEERIRRALRFFATEVLNSPLVVIPKLVIAEAENFPEIARFYVDEVIQRARGFLSDALRQGIEQGVFRPINTDHAFFSLVAPLVLAALWQRSLGPYDERKFDGEAMINDHIDLVFRGLAPDVMKGRTR